MIYCSIGWYDPQPIIKTGISTCQVCDAYLEYRPEGRKEVQSPQFDEHMPDNSYTLESACIQPRHAEGHTEMSNKH